MLQQTQATRVVDPYERFLLRFPAPLACARADLGTVLRAWAGLGHNRRARMLHRAAQMIVDAHGGVVPDRAEALRALPGVGPYTARAVLVFAYGQHHAVVDVNVARVLARAVVGAPLAHAPAQRLADELVPAGRAWEWNQTLIDIGALWCAARAPACERCPVARRCTWRRRGGAAPDPAGRRRPPAPFEGSDRQGRGRLVAAMRRGPVSAGRLAAVCGWSDDPSRARRVAGELVAEGLARRSPAGTFVLP
jgi:A/G-specific adenine glycosylase